MASHLQVECPEWAHQPSLTLANVSRELQSRLKIRARPVSLRMNEHDDCSHVAVRGEEGPRRGVRKTLRRGWRLDGVEPEDPVLPWELLSSRPESVVALSVDRVLERDAHLRAAPGVTLADNRRDRDPTRGTGGRDGATRYLRGPGCARSVWTNLVAAALTGPPLRDPPVNARSCALRTIVAMPDGAGSLARSCPKRPRRRQSPLASCDSFRARDAGRISRHSATFRYCCCGSPEPTRNRVTSPPRSEERRVGKECRL